MIIIIITFIEIMLMEIACQGMTLPGGFADMGIKQSWFC